MSSIAKLVFMFVLCTLLGCLSSRSSGIGVEKGRLYVEDSSFALNLNLIQDLREKTAEGFLHAQVAVKNTNHQDYRCQYRFEWKTAQGLVQKHAATQWRPIVLHGRETVTLDAVSPVQGTEDFRLVIRRAD